MGVATFPITSISPVANAGGVESSVVQKDCGEENFAWKCDVNATRADYGDAVGGGSSTGVPSARSCCSL